MNHICSEYCNLINEKFGDNIISIIIYGSNIYNENSSDLDVCLIAHENTTELQERIISETMKFHLKYNLRIDEEIPYSNKLIYTINEIESILSNPPFLHNGRVVINDIVKTKEFLSSKEMKGRLLLNILTTDHFTIGRDISIYENKALTIIVNAIVDYFNLDYNCEEKILDCMYKNIYTGAEGEMYLGYKKNYKEKVIYLQEKVHKTIEYLKKKNSVKKLEE